MRYDWKKRGIECISSTGFDILITFVAHYILDMRREEGIRVHDSVQYE